MESLVLLPLLALLPVTLAATAGEAKPSLRSGPLDKLDAAAIHAEDRKFLAIRELVAYLRPHDRAVAHVAISPDGAFLATSGWDNVVHLHKLGDKAPKSWAKLEGGLNGLAFSPDSKLLATGSAKTRVVGWDLTSDKPAEKESLEGHKTRPFVLAFSPNGKLLASGSQDPVLRVWSVNAGGVESWAVLENNKAPVGGVASLAFSHDAKHLVTASRFGKESLRFWKVTGDFLDERLIPAATARVLACAPTAPLVAFAGDDAAIHVWSFGGEKIDRLHKLPGHAKKDLSPPVKALTFSPDGKTLASAGQDKRVRLWNVANGEQMREWQFLDEPRALAWSSDGRHLAIGNSDGTLFLLRLETVKMKAK